jgi:hypothetical protein
VPYPELYIQEARMYLWMIMTTHMRQAINISCHLLTQAMRLYYSHCQAFTNRRQQAATCHVGTEMATGTLPWHRNPVLSWVMRHIGSYSLATRSIHWTLATAVSLLSRGTPFYPSRLPSTLIADALCRADIASRLTPQESKAQGQKKHNKDLQRSRRACLETS